MRILLIVVVFLAGCASTETRTISLSEYTTARYDRYAALPDPLFFAVTIDGHVSGYSYCAEAFNCQLRGARQTAIDACYAGSHGKACYVIARANKIIWPGKVVFKR